jgi:hypothetical protein
MLHRPDLPITNQTNITAASSSVSASSQSVPVVEKEIIFLKQSPWEEKIKEQWIDMFVSVMEEAKKDVNYSANLKRAALVQDRLFYVTPRVAEQLPNIKKYLIRLIKLLDVELQDLISISITIAIFFLQIRSNDFLNELNVHKILVTAVMVNGKFSQDYAYKNAVISTVSGIALKHLNELEVGFLKQINFDFSTNFGVNFDDFEKNYDNYCEAYYAKDKDAQKITEYENLLEEYFLDIWSQLKVMLSGVTKSSAWKQLATEMCANQLVSSAISLSQNEVSSSSFSSSSTQIFTALGVDSSAIRMTPSFDEAVPMEIDEELVEDVVGLDIDLSSSAMVLS